MSAQTSETAASSARALIFETAAVNIAEVAEVERAKMNELYTAEQNEYSDAVFVSTAGGALVTLLWDIIVRASTVIPGSQKLTEPKICSALAMSVASCLQVLLGSQFRWHKSTALQLTLMQLAGSAHRDMSSCFSNATSGLAD